MPHDEIGIENCLCRLIVVNAYTFIFGINKCKDYKDAMKIAVNVFIAVMNGNNLNTKDMLKKRWLYKMV